ncbi:DUF362 domain-containing protein, partial [[Eubacterium] cellulosolvens]
NEVVSKDDKIAIKPNLCVNKHPRTGVTTHVEVVNAIIDWINDKADKIYIMESDTPATKTTANQNFLECEYTKIRNKKVKLINLGETPHKKVSIKEGLAENNYLISEVLLKMDVLINVPVLKTHNLTANTLGTKNLFGLLSNMDKAYFHRDIWDVIDKETRQINRKIDNVTLDLYHILKEKSKLTVIDGITGSQGYAGVVFSNPVHSNLVCAGHDIFSVDCAGSKLMGIPPERIAYLKKAAEEGFGAFNKFRIIGERNPKIKKYRLGFNEAFSIMDAIFNGKNYDELQDLNVAPQKLYQILEFLQMFNYITRKEKIIRAKCSLYMNYLLGKTALL